MLHITLTSTFIWLYHIHFTDVSWWWTGLQRYYTRLGFIRSFWSFLHLFVRISDWWGSIAPLEHRFQTALEVVLEAAYQLVLVQWHNAANLRQQERSYLRRNSCANDLTPSRSSMRAWMGTAALTTRPRSRWQRIRTPVFRLSSLKEKKSYE